MTETDPTSGHAPPHGRSAAHGARSCTGRRLLGALAALGGLIQTGCHLVPAEDVKTFMVALSPRSEPELDEAELAETIRTETEVEGFEFAEAFDTGRPPLPPVFSQFIRLVAGQ